MVASFPIKMQLLYEDALSFSSLFPGSTTGLCFQHIENLTEEWGTANFGPQVGEQAIVTLFSPERACVETRIQPSNGIVTNESISFLPGEVNFSLVKGATVRGMSRSSRCKQPQVVAISLGTCQRFPLIDLNTSSRQGYQPRHSECFKGDKRHCYLESRPS